MRSIQLILFLFCSLFGFSQWDPDAGLVQSLAQQATIVADGQNQQAILDYDLETKWESEAILPTGYLQNPKLNLLLNANSATVIPLDAVAAIDGNTNNHAQLQSEGMDIRLDRVEDLKLLSLKASAKNPVIIQFFHRGMLVSTSKYLPEEAYHIKKIPLNKLIDQIKVFSSTSFLLFEIAALAKNPEVQILLDLKRSRSIGWLETKHFAGDHVTKVDVFISADQDQWQHIKSLNPKATNRVTTIFEEQQIRYIKLVYQLDMEDYAKAFLWDLKAYNRYGPYGAMPPFQRPPQPLKNVLGINTFWGWGHHKHALEIPSGKGPQMFHTFIRNVRYYHNLDWDVADPDLRPDYEHMPGSLNIEWLNWRSEYIPVWKDGYTIQTTLQIPHTFPKQVWDSVYLAAKTFGAAFGNFFSNKNNGLIETVEIGNEPWAFGADFYHQYLRGMAEGLRKSPQIKVFPCALSANHQQPFLDNYIGQWIQEQDKPLLDGLNTHLYSYCYNAQGNRVATYPEDVQSEFRGILNMISFRDKNLPHKPIHVTEWGWDSDSPETTCTHSECVGQESQAAYALRGLLMLYRLGVDRLHWYYFADEDKPSMVFTRSGLLTSPEKGMQPKRAYHALKNLVSTVGELYLIDALEDSDGLWQYDFGMHHETRFKIIWLAKTHHPNIKKTVIISIPGKVKKAWYPGKPHQKAQFNQINNQAIELKVGTYPIIMEIE